MLKYEQDKYKDPGIRNSVGKRGAQRIILFLPSNWHEIQIRTQLSRYKGLEHQAFLTKHV